MTIVDDPKSLNGPKYCQGLQAFLPHGQAFYPDGFILQRDGARAHTSTFAQNWFADNGLQIMQWSANSADLLPIENVWKILRKNITWTNRRQKMFQI